jgi:hypothetical protein
LIQAFVRLLLVLDVLPYGRFVSAYGRDQVPLAQKFCPTKLRFLSPYVGAKWIALLPLMKPTTCETAYFGGIEIIM